MIGGPYVRHFFGEEVTARYRQHEGWITASVHHSIPWPERDVMVEYDGDDFFLRGLRQNTSNGDIAAAPCITMRGTQHNIHEVLNKIYRFCSILGWYKKGYVDVVGHILGSRPVLYSAGSQRYASTMAGGPEGFECNYLPLVRDENTRRALAFWREGQRLARIHDGYAFLSFHKVIESQFANGREKGRWITSAIPTLEGDAMERVAQLQQAEVDVGMHLFESCRCAVAHASLEGNLIDPDIPADRLRISEDLVIITALARKYIKEELGVPNDSEVYEHRDRLQPLYEYMDADQLLLLQRGEAPTASIGLEGIRISVCKWPNSPPTAFTGLALNVDASENGLVKLVAINDATTLIIVFVLDFPNCRAHTQIEDGGFIDGEHATLLDEATAFAEFQKAVIGNQTIEIVLPNDQRVQCEVVIPVNIDSHRTYAAIDAGLDQLRARIAQENA